MEYGKDERGRDVSEALAEREAERCAPRKTTRDMDAPLEKGPLIDRAFHEAARKIVHTACETILPGDGGLILELLSGPGSLMPRGPETVRVVGTGANRDELASNRGLAHRLVVDVTRSPLLPFSENVFSGAVLLFGVEMLLDPEATFAEVARVLKPDAPFLVVFTSCTDERFSLPRWRFMDNQERLSFVAACFERTEPFGRITAYGTRKRRRSEASRKQRPVAERAPVWIAHARKVREDVRREAPWKGKARTAPAPGRDPLVCPYCGDGLKKWEVPHSPFEIENWYETDVLYICFNDECPYFQRGWQWMWSKLKRNVSYRHMYNPVTRRTGPMPVPTAHALRDGIIDEDGDAAAA